MLAACHLHLNLEVWQGEGDPASTWCDQHLLSTCCMPLFVLGAGKNLVRHSSALSIMSQDLRYELWLYDPGQATKLLCACFPIRKMVPISKAVVGI